MSDLLHIVPEYAASVGAPTVPPRPSRPVVTAKAEPRSFTISYGVIAFFLLVANLRPALTSVGPVLEAIRSSLDLSGTAAGLLPTLPLLIFAAFAPFARLDNVFGIERTLAGCLTLTVAGIVLRSQGSIAALFAGTAIFAIGGGSGRSSAPRSARARMRH